MAHLVQKFIVEDVGKASSILPQHVALVSPDGKPLPKGIRTEIRHIMQRSHFVVPDYVEAAKDIKRVTELKDLLDNGGLR